MAAQHFHQHPGHQRANAGTHAVGNQKHGGQRHPALAFDVVVGEGHGQRVDAKLQQCAQEPRHEQHLDRHLREDRQR